MAGLFQEQAAADARLHCGRVAPRTGRVERSARAGRCAHLLCYEDLQAGDVRLQPRLLLLCELLLACRRRRRRHILRGGRGGGGWRSCGCCATGPERCWLAALRALDFHLLFPGAARGARRAPAAAAAATAAAAVAVAAPAACPRGASAAAPARRLPCAGAAARRRLGAREARERGVAFEAGQQLLRALGREVEREVLGAGVGHD
jgi:hypothetical protein